MCHQYGCPSPFVCPHCYIKIHIFLFLIHVNALRDIYIPKGCKPKGNVFHVFRLLILYHDPELCTMLDTKKITPDLYSMQWFRCLFASSCSLTVILSMWDLYFQHADPFMVFFLALIILVNGRDLILEMKDATKEDLIKFLSNMPCALEPDDVVDFCSLAQYYSLKTPSSFKTDFLKALYGSQCEKTPHIEPCSVSQVSKQIKHNVRHILKCRLLKIKIIIKT